MSLGVACGWLGPYFRIRYVTRRDNLGVSDNQPPLLLPPQSSFPSFPNTNFYHFIFKLTILITIDWLGNGSPRGGSTSFNPQPPYTSRQIDTASPMTTSSHRSPQFRSFIARYSDCSTPISHSVRAKSPPATPIHPGLFDLKNLPIIATSHPQPNTKHPMHRETQTSNSPLLLTPPPSSDPAPVCSPLYPVTRQCSTNSNASIKLPALPYPPCPLSTVSRTPEVIEIRKAHYLRRYTKYAVRLADPIPVRAGIRAYQLPVRRLHLADDHSLQPLPRSRLAPDLLPGPCLRCSDQPPWTRQVHG